MQAVHLMQAQLCSKRWILVTGWETDGGMPELGLTKNAVFTLHEKHAFKCFHFPSVQDKLIRFNP